MVGGNVEGQGRGSKRRAEEEAKGGVMDGRSGGSW